HVVRQGADVLFDGPHDQERWNVRWRQNEVEIMRLWWRGEEQSRKDVERSSPGARQEAFVLLTLEHNGRVVPMSFSQKVREGDRAAVAVYTAVREDAVAQLALLGWQEEPAGTGKERSRETWAGTTQS